MTNSCHFIWNHNLQIQNNIKCIISCFLMVNSRAGFCWATTITKHWVWGMDESLCQGAACYAKEQGTRACSPFVCKYVDEPCAGLCQIRIVMAHTNNQRPDFRLNLCQHFQWVNCGSSGWQNLTLTFMCVCVCVYQYLGQYSALVVKWMQRNSRI